MNKLGLVLVSVFFIAGCATGQRTGGPSGTSSTVSTPDGSSTTAPTTPSETPPTSPSHSPQKVALILGPGGVKTWAQAGVLKELEKARIPIHEVVGMEWGAVIGSLYALNGKVHELEWKLYKLQTSKVFEKSLLGSSSGISIEALDGFMKENMNGVEIERLAVPFFCPSLSLATGTLYWYQKGSIQTAIKKCLAYPPFMKSKDQWAAAGFSLRDIATYLRSKKYDVILFVNVLPFQDEAFAKDLAGSPEAYLLWEEVRRSLSQAAELKLDVIPVNTGGISFVDPRGREELVRRGEEAGKKASEQLINKYGF